MGAIRSVLLHLDASPNSAARLVFARNLALRFEAALGGMFVASPLQCPPELAFAEGRGALVQPLDRAAMERERTRFASALAEGGPAMHWLESVGINAGDAFCRQALYADLLVLGQHDPDAARGGSAPADFVESVLIATGKPAIVLPAAGEFEPFGRDVLIGWNATPQAARAVTAALPWLRGARRVHVLLATSEARQNCPFELGIAQYLQFHGIVPALHHDHAKPADVGGVLLSFARDLDADLLVMGCCSHGQAHERVLGGASRTVLRAMGLPVLMAH